MEEVRLRGGEEEDVDGGHHDEQVLGQGVVGARCHRKST